MRPYVLSLDWDFFVGHFDGIATCGSCRECPQHITCGSGLRDSKRQGFFKKNERILSTIIEKLRKRNIKKFIVAESHGSILKFIPKKSHVVNIDLHHDDYGDMMEHVTCGNWVTHGEHKGNISKYSWLSDCDIRNEKDITIQRLGLKKDVDILFLCLSSPWTARETDKLFYKSVKKISDSLQVKPLFVGRTKNSMMKNYNRSTKNV